VTIGNFAARHLDGPRRDNVRRRFSQGDEIGRPRSEAQLTGPLGRERGAWGRTDVPEPCRQLRPGVAVPVGVAPPLERAAEAIATNPQRSDRAIAADLSAAGPGPASWGHPQLGNAMPLEAVLFPPQHVPSTPGPNLRCNTRDHWRRWAHPRNKTSVSAHAGGTHSRRLLPAHPQAWRVWRPGNAWVGLPVSLGSILGLPRDDRGKVSSAANSSPIRKTHQRRADRLLHRRHALRRGLDRP
jgi:hypothetical protein